MIKKNTFMDDYFLSYAQTLCKIEKKQWMNAFYR